METPGDSGPGGPGTQDYTVRAEGSRSAVWESDIASGYSIDNLAPEAPQNLSGTVVSARVTLWSRMNLEDDLLEYRAYRSAEPNTNATVLQAPGSSADTLVADNSPLTGNAFLTVVAVDVHGNRSGKSNEIVLVVQDAELKPSVPRVFSLAPDALQSFDHDPVCTARRRRSALGGV